jgi:ABC-2 type transport system permease protein
VSSLSYTRYELLRTFRNQRFLLLSLAFPLVLYLLIAGPNRHEHDLAGTGVSAPLYFMVGLASFGAMNAMVSSGARIATERAAGWNRQLRLTPLSARAYFRSKIVNSYLMAGATIVLLYAAGASLGVRLPAGKWLEMTGLMLVGLVPFAALGVLMGHKIAPDSIGPAMGGLVALLAFLGGSWFPITGGGTLQHIAQDLPSYWLVQASHVSLGGQSWGAKGWLVVGAWTVVLTVAAARAYRDDTERASPR